ncbi:unnamed protein product [Mytilus edulis]|uniref:CUB domain-containing protein n=1 Tax=Mytilus edulis TaxID=6550 RepID=A0A8S3U2T4_MYTED|nr:unnamed protein product [Mytilus edulis]CAG2236314.1 unnamed protein product [Mytilus edulis]
MMKLNAVLLVVFAFLLSCQIVEGCTCKTHCDIDNERKDANGVCCHTKVCCLPCTDTLECTSRNGKCQATCGENEIATDTACCNGLKCCEMPQCTNDKNCNCKTECDGTIEREDINGSCCDNSKCCKPCTDDKDCNCKTECDGTIEREDIDGSCCDNLKCCKPCADDTDCNCETKCDGVIKGEERAGSCCDNLKCCKPCTGVCGGNFTELIGSFSSTNYPCNYPINQDCFYSISVPVGYTITLTFTTFLLEVADFDFVDVYDGESVNDPLLLHQTGGPLDGTTAQSTANKMLVRFISDYGFDWPGFNANYIATITG